jgi:hypothetical protein
VIDKNGIEAPFIFRLAERFSEGLAVAMTDKSSDGYGYVDETFQMVLPQTYYYNWYDGKPREFQGGFASLRTVTRGSAISIRAARWLSRTNTPKHRPSPKMWLL